MSRLLLFLHFAVLTVAVLASQFAAAEGHKCDQETCDTEITIPYEDTEAGRIVPGISRGMRDQPLTVSVTSDCSISKVLVSMESEFENRKVLNWTTEKRDGNFYVLDVDLPSQGHAERMALTVTATTQNGFSEEVAMLILVPDFNITSGPHPQRKHNWWALKLEDTQ